MMQKAISHNFKTKAKSLIKSTVKQCFHQVSPSSIKIIIQIFKSSQASIALKTFAARTKASLFVVEDPAINNPGTKKPPPFGRGLPRSVDLNFLGVPDQPIAGAWRATGVDSAAARSRGKL